MQGSDFSKVRVGDRIWDYINQRWNTVVDIRPKEGYPVKFKNDFGVYDSCTIDGKQYANDESPVYFWDEIKFEIPPPPKRMVKKKFDYWDLADKTGNLLRRKYKTRQEAEVFCKNHTNYIYPTFVSYEIEVEE